jgi:hypothetical protein
MYRVVVSEILMVGVDANLTNANNLLKVLAGFGSR